MPYKLYVQSSHNSNTVSQQDWTRAGPSLVSCIKSVAYLPFQGSAGVTLATAIMFGIRGQCLFQGTEGTPLDKLRLVLVWLLTAEALPSDADMERLLIILATAGADTTAVAYLRRMRSMKLTGAFACQL